MSMQISTKTKYMSIAIYHSAQVAVCYTHLSGTTAHCKAQYVKNEHYQDVWHHVLESTLKTTVLVKKGVERWVMLYHGMLLGDMCYIRARATIFY